MRYSKPEQIAIITEQSVNKTNIAALCRKYKISTRLFYDWKIQLGMNDLEGKLKELKLKPSIKINFVSSGLNKNYFLEDCLNRDWTRGKLIKHIIDVYYSIINSRPDMQGKEIKDITPR